MRTSKNQLTLPKAVVEQVGYAEDDDVIGEDGRSSPVMIRVVLDTNGLVSALLVETACSRPFIPGPPRRCAATWRSSASARPMWLTPSAGLASNDPRGARHQRAGVGVAL